MPESWYKFGCNCVVTAPMLCLNPGSGRTLTFMKRHFLFPIIAFSLCISTAFARDAFQFLYELRVPKTARVEPLTSFDVVTDSDSSGTRLRLTKRREEGASLCSPTHAFSSPAIRDGRWL